MSVLDLNDEPLTYASTFEVEAKTITIIQKPKEESPQELCRKTLKARNDPAAGYKLSHTYRRGFTIERSTNLIYQALKNQAFGTLQKYFWASSYDRKPEIAFEDRIQADGAMPYYMSQSDSKKLDNNISQVAEKLIRYQAAAARGDTKASYELGLIYEDGAGVFNKNPKDSASILSSGSQEGNPDIAQNRLARAYENVASLDLKKARAKRLAFIALQLTRDIQLRSIA